MLPMVTDRSPSSDLSKIQVRGIARQQVVDDAYTLSIAQKTLGDMRADETGATSHYIALRHGSPLIKQAATIGMIWRKCKR